ncbi:MAG: hypothetical protein M0D55_13280 [Elusimicrobiota bacterium]|nr:MAG: hypothetical protein M0D55_13280 [Elusimicrobiota bacterium]
MTSGTLIGDGSNLSGTASIILNATQTFTGATTFSSSFTVQSSGRIIRISTSASTNIIAIDTDGAIRFIPTLHNSSSTSIPSVVTSNTALGPCVSGSTLAITTTGGQVEAQFTGLVTNPNTSTTTAIAILQDGQFVGNMSATKPLIKGGRKQSFHLSQYIQLSLRSPAAWIAFILHYTRRPGWGDAAIVNSAGVTSNFFYLKEIK